MFTQISIILERFNSLVSRFVGRFNSFYEKHLNTSLRALLVILFLAFAIRAPFITWVGHKEDMRVNQGWMQSATILGVPYSFDRQINVKIMKPNHGPVEIYVYQFAGNLYRMFFSPDYVEMKQPAHRAFTKFPGVASDFLICIILYFAFRRIRNAKAGFIAGAAYALHPVAWHDSAFWGQTDPLYSVLLLIAILGLARNRVFIASAFYTFALLTKPQALIFAPLFVLFCDRKLVVYLKAAFASLLASFVTLLPFLLQGNVASAFHDYSEMLWRSGNRLCANAFNFWWAIYGTDAFNYIQGRDILIGSISYRTVGSAIFSCFVATALYVCWKRLQEKQDRTEQLLLCAAVIASAFFMFMSSMHERYFYPYIVLAFPLVFMGRQALIAYVGLCFFFYVNVWIVLPFGDMDRRWHRMFDIKMYDAIGETVMFAYYMFIYLFCLPKRGTDVVPATPPTSIISVFRRLNKYLDSVFSSY